MNLRALQHMTGKLAPAIDALYKATATRSDLAALLLEEAGELARASRLHGVVRPYKPGEAPGKAHHVTEELGDVLFLLARLALEHGVDLEMAGEAGVAKLIERTQNGGTFTGAGECDLTDEEAEEGPPFFWHGAALDNLVAARELVLAGRMAEAVHLWAAAYGKLGKCLDMTLAGDMRGLVDSKTMPLWVDGSQVLITLDRELPDWAREIVARGVAAVVKNATELADKEDRPAPDQPPGELVEPGHRHIRLVATIQAGAGLRVPVDAATADKLAAGVATFMGIDWAKGPDTCVVDGQVQARRGYSDEVLSILRTISSRPGEPCDTGDLVDALGDKVPVTDLLQGMAEEDGLVRFIAREGWTLTAQGRAELVAEATDNGTNFCRDCDGKGLCCAYVGNRGNKGMDGDTKGASR